MEFKNPDLAEAFYLQNRDILKHLSLDQVKSIIWSPYLHMRNCMESDDLPQIRLKYLASFQPTVRRCKDQMKRNDNFFKKGHITEEEHKEAQRILQKFIDENNNNKNKSVK